MRLLIQHRTLYRYPRAALLGPHQIRLRPADHAKARVESYSLNVTTPGALRWVRDASANHVAHLTFPKGASLAELEVRVELAVDIRPVNPFDFFVDDRCRHLPFEYPAELRGDLAPFLDLDDPAVARGRRFQALLEDARRLARSSGEASWSRELALTWVTRRATPA